MLSFLVSLGAFLSRSFRFLPSSAGRKLRRQMVSWLVLMSLLCQTVPAAPQTLVATGQAWRAELGFQFYAHGWPGFFQGLLRPQSNAARPVQEQQNSRDDQVRRLHIYPENVSLQPGAQVQFVAVAYDNNNQPVGGIHLQWKVRDRANNRNLRIRDGLFAPNYAGQFDVEVKFRNLRANTNVTRLPGPEPNPNATPGPVTPVSTRHPPPVTQQARARRAKKPVSKTAHARAAAPAAFVPHDGWNNGNYWASDDYDNRVGNVPGSPADGGAGSGNFQFAAPILSLPGRGIDVALGLAYNSRLWAKAGNEITYDIDRGWPAPGWNLGFGKIVGIAPPAGAPPGQLNGALLIEPDGTRHSYYGGVVNYGPGQNRFVGHTTDGSFIDYIVDLNNNGKAWKGWAYYPNGTIIEYNAYDDLYADPNGRAIYPTRITDASGNFVTIAYPNNVGPRISLIKDTLGRSINFHYDANNLLTAITAPTVGEGNNTRQVVRLRYKTLSLGYNFPGLTTRVENNYPVALEAIYYPATGTGYWLGGNDAYSSYGMLAQVVEKRGMGFSAASLNEPGTVTDPGLTTQQQSYNYEMTATNGLSDAPTYTQLTETWTKDGSATAEAVTLYASQPNANPRTVSVTNQTTGLQSIQYSYHAPNQWNDGLVYSDVTKDAANHTLQSSSAVWQEGAYHSPRPLAVTQTDERNQTTGQEFVYGSLYNQVAQVREYGYGYAYGDEEENPNRLLRRTVTEYENSSNYLWTSYPMGGYGRHIFNLPKKVERYAGAAGGGVKMARVEYQYDGQTLINAQSNPAEPGVVQHQREYNPHSGTYLVEQCITWHEQYGHCIEWEYVEQLYYYASTGYRGNVTQVKTWADATNDNDLNAVEETRHYDITGNLRATTTTGCCQQMSYEYTNATQFAYPESQTRGASDANNYNARVTTSAVYDFHTGLATGGTDADGRTGSTVYDSASLRPVRVNHALVDTNQPHTDFTYNDTAMTVTEDTYLDHTASASALVSQNVKLLNGQGQVRQEQARGASTGAHQWDYVDTEYDNLGRVSKQTRPYRYGVDTPQWLYTYDDILGRTNKTIVPDGTGFEPDGVTPKGQVSQYFYNETARPAAADPTAPGQTTRLRDAWGRERWGRSDASGNLVEVVEPNPDGDGAVASGGLQTTYQYDALNRLTQTMQGAQTRQFAYDSLGRLTRQKLAETEARLNEAGNYVGAGGVWSDAFVYDARSNLTQRTDARGVKTLFNYNSDPLNRLQEVSYDTSAANDGVPANSYLRVADTAPVTYTYRTRSGAGDLQDVSEVQSVTAAGVSVEEYTFDATEKRILEAKLTLASRSNYPMRTGYEYDKLNRVTKVTYPGKDLYNNTSRQVVEHSYDIAGRLSQMTVDNVVYTGGIQYNAASQTTALNIGPNNGNQLSENYAYDPRTGLLTDQTVTRAGNNPATLLNLSYDYNKNISGQNKITGALVSLTDNLNHAKNKNYEYDALGRLTKATGGPSANPVWAQRYLYDRYGNRGNVLSYNADQYVRNFYQIALNRQPNTTELQNWLNDLQTAYPDPSAYRGTMQSLGVTLFESQEYLNRNRTDAEFVSDLYKTYLFRDPDGDPNNPNTGWGYWTSQVASQGRDKIRDAFAESGEFAVKLEGTSPAKPANGAVVPRDGWEALSFDSATNRITTSGFEYDAAGNQTQSARIGGGYQRYQYDAAHRLVKVYDGNNTLLQTVTYGATNQRLVVQDGDANSNNRTYYAAAGGTVLAEYGETPANPTTPTWSKTYLYLGARLLATFTPNGGGEYTQYHHPDRLGTRLLTNASDTTAQEQATLPFGSALEAESTGATSRRFTSYDRSVQTGLDYAVNRHYDSQQGRFTQVDPIEMDAASLGDPQSLNLYSYVGNDPINRTDPDGLFWGKLWRGIKKVLSNKWVALAIGIAIAVLTVGAAIGLWSLTTKTFVFAGSASHFKTTLTGLGWLVAGLSTAAALPHISFSWGGIRRNLLSFAGNFSLRQVTGFLAGLGESGPWNEQPGAVNNFRKPRKRPGAFQTVTDAAIAALSRFNFRSIRDDREYAGAICESKNGSLFYTIPNKRNGSIGTAHSSTVPSCSRGTRVGSFHTHGAESGPDYDDENFSPQDRINANNRSLQAGQAVPNFLATPSGVVRRFSPAAIANSTRGRVVTLRTRVPIK